MTVEIDPEGQTLRPPESPSGQRPEALPSRLVPELPLAGRERPFGSCLARRQMRDPSAPTEDDIDEMAHPAGQPARRRR
jgi:hypothetical protein